MSVDHTEQRYLDALSVARHALSSLETAEDQVRKLKREEGPTLFLSDALIDAEIVVAIASAEYALALAAAVDAFDALEIDRL